MSQSTDFAVSGNSSVISLDEGDATASKQVEDVGGSDKPEEACGVFGVHAPENDVATLTYFGLYALQHRGQESAGIASFDQGEVHTLKGMGLVSQIFTDKDLHEMPGEWAVGHTRYSTTGSSHAANAQPAIVSTRLGDLALAHNGNIVNVNSLRAALLERNHSLVTTSDSELIAIALAEAVNDGESWESGAIAAFKRCEGAFSLVIGTPEGIIAARDPHGIRPLVLGYIGSSAPEEKGAGYGPGKLVVASETCGLDIVGATYLRDVDPGEMLVIDDSGVKSVQWAQAERKLCVFEMIYFARPDSVFHGESLYSYRKRIGQRLAQESPADVDLIMAVPDSGVPAAIGYSEASGIPYAEGLIKNRYVGRTFIQPTQAMRETGIRMKLNPMRDVLEGKRILIVDDSIVRGTTSRKLVKMLYDAGATEVHMRISSPPVTHPCFYGIDTDNQDHLIAATKSVAEIEQQLGADSLAYLSWEGMLEETRAATSSFCSACFTGAYPIEIPEQVKRSKLMLEKIPAGVG
ncbi:amidophosphoribosyltransferase [cf. Phormidesmis sp. LEGE 11477]|uniref:amidophosphoribosyltransferase n=1 Tax=cf. Phormidesmis sp. LEGE 11477 TaxID=1828680 RepID=UPI00187EB2FF|nr:amidophosphoribosyltransferase [cf. Phormidesmis sp. LEGE 11477]MBE9061239.1 amidophosphoribosyltransferase [cf. Phormidesmis sp. LEGE 11477]